MPLTTVSVSDPLGRCQIKTGSAWTGAPEGLTIQRSIRALESYDHFAELTLIGRALTAALRRGCQSNSTGPSSCRFPTAIDPYTGVPHTGDAYGPMIMAFFEHLARRVGVVAVPERGLLWSGLQEGANSTYTQVLGGRRFTLHLNGSSFAAKIDGAPLFRCSIGVRVITDVNGRVMEVWGIDTQPHQIKLQVAGAAPLTTLGATIKPNEVWAVISKHEIRRVRAAPFVGPHG